MTPVVQQKGGDGDGEQYITIGDWFCSLATERQLSYTLNSSFCTISTWVVSIEVISYVGILQLQNKEQKILQVHLSLPV